MSNRRRPGFFTLYRSEFLQSRVWFERRDRWFADQRATRCPLVCAACAQSATRTQLELHHLDYEGVTLREGRWAAAEPHEDLVPLHPYCHELLHRLIDRDAVLSRSRARRVASLEALKRLRLKLAPLQEPQ